MINKDQSEKLNQKLNGFYQAVEKVYSTNMDSVIEKTKKIKEEKKKMYYAEKALRKEIVDNTIFPEHAKKNEFDKAQYDSTQYQMVESNNYIVFNKIKSSTDKKEQYYKVNSECYLEDIIENEYKLVC